MRSITAAGTRKQDDSHGMFSMKRSMEDSMDDGHHKANAAHSYESKQKANMMSRTHQRYHEHEHERIDVFEITLRPSMGMGQMNQGQYHRVR
jgi:hypothetical protein